ncbi:MAG: ATP-dependent RecD-like DNA helicase [Lachnospiraceae bacterium]|nr:ATP-dependent RecD-like DNA helicase [Lachnospiraceae bacterium]
MEQREGYVERIVYRNSENGYTVLSLVSADGSEETTCVGSFPMISEGEFVAVEGNSVSHAIYGEQLQVTRFEVKTPTDKAAMERYLGSGAIKGVGATLAGRIVRRFGERTFQIIEREPERLAEVKGISERMAREIFEQFQEKRAMRDAMLYLQRYGITTNLAVKIYKQYGERMQEVLETNPYRLTEDIQGVGFRIADEIAGRIGIGADSDYRVRAGILYALQLGSQSGHVYLPKERLLPYTAELLGVSEEAIERQLAELALERKLMIKTIPREDGEPEEQIYAASYYFTELSIARMLLDLNIRYDVPAVRLNAKVAQIESELNITLDEIQREAVFEAARSGLFLLTGGPGTGKTTTINAIIRLFESEGMEMLLAAPTGRAAKRMTEATGVEARTIHRLLEVTMTSEKEGGGVFGRNEETPLETDVVIIDEMSMVDIFLMNALLRAIPAGTRLILVGDSDQLPSVGPGNVLKDIMSSRAFSVVTLTKIFRQAEESDIIVNAHKINRGEPIAFTNKSRDFFLLRREQPQTIVSVLLQLVEQKLPKYVGATPYDIQVLTPMRKGELGVERLNQILQERLNPPDGKKVEYEYRSTLFREGDKVMQIRNNYQIPWEVRSRYGIPVETGTGIFNGDMGIIQTINRFAETMEIRFDENHMVEYPFSQLDELEHAYAITIHKSQGSEYPAVVMPLLTGPRMLFNRNLLYTGVTRATRCVTLVGSEGTILRMIANANEQKRHTGLTERIREITKIQTDGDAWGEMQ